MTNEEKILDILVTMQAQMDAWHEKMDVQFNAMKTDLIRLDNNLDSISSQLDDLLEGQRVILEMLTPHSPMF